MLRDQKHLNLRNELVSARQRIQNPSNYDELRVVKSGCVGKGFEQKKAPGFH